MSIKGIYDIHCHIVPGVDDGATDIGETVKLLRMEYEQGVRTVITTPHFRFRMFETPAEKVREQFRLVDCPWEEVLVIVSFFGYLGFVFRILKAEGQLSWTGGLGICTDCGEYIFHAWLLF